MADTRGRNFVTVVYPDSAPENWKQLLSEHHIPAFISPLHDNDINPTGEEKKAHYHVLVMFEGKKSDEQIKELFNEIGGVGLEKVGSLRGYARYLCHLDNPDKAQYPPDQVTSMHGADYINIIGLASDKYNAIKEMMAYCVSENCLYFCDLLMYASIHRSDWFRVLCDSGTVVIKEYLKSLDYSIKNGFKADIDEETGEIVFIRKKNPVLDTLYKDTYNNPD